MKDERAPEGPADEEELESAAALAHALESGADGPHVPRAALETAALLRLSAGAGELGAERRDAIRQELLAGLPARSERRRRSPWLVWTAALPRWSFLALPLLGTAVVGLLLLVKGPEPEASFAERSSVVQGGAAPESAAAAGQSAADEESAEEKAAAAMPTEAARESTLALARPPAARGGDSAAPRAVPAPGAFLPAEEPTGLGAMASSEAPAPQAVAARRSAATDGAGNLAEGLHQPSTRDALVGLDRVVRAERSQLLARTNDPELSRAHAELDGARSPSELERSQASLTRLLQTAGDGLDANDARQVRQDVYCRLAETALRLGEPRAALEWTRQGIALDGPPSPFLAQLMALEGDAFAELGEPSSAAASYLKALRMHEALLIDILE